MRIFELILGEDSKGLISLEEIEILCSLLSAHMDEEKFKRFISHQREPMFYKNNTIAELKDLINTSGFAEEDRCMAYIYGYCEDAVESLIEKIKTLNDDECKELLQVLNSSKAFFDHFQITDPSREYQKYRRLYEGYKQAYEDLVKISEREMDTTILAKALLRENGLDYWANGEEQSEEFAQILEDELKKYSLN